MILRTVRYLLMLTCLAGTPALAQSVWFELGWAYDEVAELEFASGPKLGVRGIYPVNGSVGIYLHPYIFTGFEADSLYSFAGSGFDMGVWYDFRTSPQDLEGFHSYAGVGLSVMREQLGVALNGAFSYEVARNLELALIFTYRPLIRPAFSQAFDVSLGIRYDFE